MPGEAQLLDPPDPKTSIWGYGGRTPGPTLRVPQGGELQVRFRNSLSKPSTIHWHGIRIDNAMDGVGHLTQHPVEPGETFDYRFRCPDAGTFWYHPHMHEPEQLARGLCGALIVEEPAPPQVDQDLLLVIGDWRLGDDGRLHEASFGALHDKAHAGRLGNTITVNGDPVGIFPVRRHERLRLRLVNTANARVLRLLLERAAPKIIAIDGQPITPREIYVGGFDLPPGGRMDLVLDVLGEAGAVLSLTEVSRERLEIARLEIGTGASARTGPLAAPIALAPNPVPMPDMTNLLPIELAMAGGAMGTMQGAMVDGEHLALRELVRKHGYVWSFNGVAGMPTEPLFRAPRGRTVAIRMINDTRWPHAMHVHGYHFKVIARSVREPDGYWWDTLLLAPAETATIAFLADNPGKWMLHCHMLEHQAGGMMTWFEVG
jgi:FtsP/CotA-like multicopper oxidase with cupredoxin domain